MLDAREKEPPREREGRRETEGDRTRKDKPTG